MNKNYLAWIIAVLVSLSISSVARIFAPAVEIVVAPAASAKWDASSLQQASEILTRRMQINLKGRYTVRIINQSQFSVALYDTNDLGLFQKIAVEIGAIGFVDSLEPFPMGAEVDPSLRVILTEADVSSAKVEAGFSGTGYIIAITLTPDGAQKLADYSKNNIGHYLVIVRDGIAISSPSMASEITGDQAVIEGNFTEDSANELASVLFGHRLPFALKIISVKSR